MKNSNSFRKYLSRLSGFRLTISCLLLFLFSAGSFAQSNEHKWNIGIMGGFSVYAGDLGNSMTKFTGDVFKQNPTGGINVSRYINKSLDVAINSSLGSWGYYSNDLTVFKGYMMHGNLNLKFKFNNGYMLTENSKVAPFIFAGIGMSDYTGSRINNGQDYPIIGGGGVRFRLSNTISINYQATFGYMGTAHNNPETSNGFKPTGTDQFMTHMVGVGFNLGNSRDSDKDGVNDKMDKCPNTPTGVSVDVNGCAVDKDADGVADFMDKCPDQYGLAQSMGCPDADKDGVSDMEDQCPNVPGLLAFNGCPDTDGDGIADNKDKCPTLSGTVALEGCPDKDKDGIKDSEDACPDIYGSSQTNGCPDTDNDGVHDGLDKCPLLPGSLMHNGCPDTDKDGIFDDVDRCVNLVGVVANQGCPEIKKETKQLFQKALQGIQFETGKDLILPVSYPILDAIVKVMNDNPTYKLMIGGHTDNVGEDEMNATLSQNRATAVSKYLIGKGVNPMKLSATGYGETKPVDTNESVEGLTRNRRVELDVEFLQ